jgi:creatinine amidohydrolase
MDFPGTVTITWDVFCRYCTDVARSLVHHGFRRVLLVNGHGSNQNLVEMAARLAVVDHPEALVAACFYLTSAQGAAAIAQVRSSDIGGMGHACELETSIYLYLDAAAVDMSKAVDERGFPATEHSFMDWSDGPLKIMPWWSSFSRSGVQGDATEATAAKGKTLYEAAVAEICGYVQELRATDIAARKDHHDAKG